MTTATDKRPLEHRIGPDGVFVLRLNDGDARLRGVDGDTVSIRADDGRFDAFDVDQGEGSLTVKSRHGQDGSGRGSSDPDLVIDLPAGATVVVEAGSADIVAVGLTGDVRMTTTSGDLTARDAGGSLRIEAVSGDIEIDAPDSLSVVARTVSGDLALSAGTLHELAATTTSGDLMIAGRFTGDGPFVIETVSGDATLEPAGDLRIDFATLTGDVHGREIGHRSGRDRAPIIIGAGDGPTVSFRSTSGDLAVTPRAAAVATDEASQPAAASSAPAVPPPPVHMAVVEDDASIDILRALERGDIDIEEASRQLAALDADDAEQTRA